MSLSDEANKLFKSDAFKAYAPASNLGFKSVGAFQLNPMIAALEKFESLVATDIAVFASCPAKVSIGLMLQLQLKINKMVQISEELSGLLSNLNSMASTTIRNSKSS